MCDCPCQLPHLLYCGATEILQYGPQQCANPSASTKIIPCDRNFLIYILRATVIVLKCAGVVGNGRRTIEDQNTQKVLHYLYKRNEPWETQNASIHYWHQHLNLAMLMVRTDGAFLRGEHTLAYRVMPCSLLSQML